MPLPLIALGVVFVLIAVRQVGRLRLQIWQIMLGGALTVLVTGFISPSDAVRSINPDVMLFLFGMFVVGQALEDSGYLAHTSYGWVRRAAKRDSLLWMLVFGSGLLSAVLMNDTLAIVGTPVVLLLARKHEMSPQLLLLALAFGITTGSVMSPIGNPQNLLIALSGGVPNQFLTFLGWLGIPTLINLALTALFLRRLYPDDFHATDLRHSQEPIRDKHLAGLAKLSLLITLVLIAFRIALSVAGIEAAFSLTHIALAAALPVLVGSPKRIHVLRHLDWTTLVFFAAMFVLMRSVWDTGLLQSWMSASGLPLGAPETILGIRSAGRTLSSRAAGCRIDDRRPHGAGCRQHHRRQSPPPGRGKQHHHRGERRAPVQAYDRLPGIRTGRDSSDDRADIRLLGFSAGRTVAPELNPDYFRDERDCPSGYSPYSLTDHQRS